jgi:transcription termination/antitermination protein NusA
MKNEFILAFNEVLEEKQLPREIIMQALEAAMVSAYRRDVNASSAQHVEARINPETGKVVIFAEKEVVDEVQDDRTEVSLKNALQVNPDAELGGMVVVETTPKDFGRVAAQTARQVIQQRIREAERETQSDYFSKQVGEIISGIVQAITAQGLTLGLDMKAEGILPRNQQIPGERFRVHDRIQALLMEVKQSNRGPQIVLSRAHRNFLRRLLENEVPEIYHGLVEIRSIAREPGQRSKVAVSALQPAVDPVGACVGIRGVRIQAIVRELNDEKIDVIEWNADPAVYISKALSPARVNGVYLNDTSRGAKTATVVVPEDQLSLAIGRDGQNARLAAKLTGWRIDIKSLPEATADSLYKLQTEPEYAFLMDVEGAVIPQIEQILAKKSEGRPVTPEEYTVLAQFVDRVERGIIRRRESERREEDTRYKELKATIPETVFEIPLVDLPLSDKLFDLLSEAGYDSAGSLLLQIKLDPDEILKINGVGPRAMDEIKSILSTLEFPEQQISGESVESLEQPELAAETAPIGEIEREEIGEELEVSTIEELSIPEGEPLATNMGAFESPDQPVEEIEVELETQLEETGEEEPVELEDLFALRPEKFDTSSFEVDEESDEEDALLPKKGKKAKKKKKRRNVEMEYDPDLDIMVVKRKRKGESEWEDEWEI